MSHPLIADVTAAYLDAVDTEAPGLVQGLYLVGSAAVGDFRPGASDIDFVAVSAQPVAEQGVAALRRAHTTLAARHPRPHFDGIYVTWADLAGEPSRVQPGAGAHEGRVHRRADGGWDPVAWHTLAECGVPIRGPGRADVPVWTDRTALIAWCRQNLTEYWQPWLRGSSRLVSRPGLVALSPWAAAWGVLGVSRLHYTIATGAITSKAGAGGYARQTFHRRWWPVLDECLRIRSGGGGRSLYRSVLRRRRDALDFVAMAIDSASHTG
ncbi:MAG TPA: nucleotidyltransferase domain-containing protein [Micromonosporaceae bacterium]|nr:nucleotidyltransferase domain-containing protein [Micromonosporaceae bacterium]